MSKLLKLIVLFVALSAFPVFGKYNTPLSVGDITKKDETLKLLLLNFNDFGPPSMSFDLLGQSWWRWESSGSSDPMQRYPIQVVVYKGVGLNSAMLKYPSNQKRLKDYRYISLKQAIDYLNENIEDDVIPEITHRLKRTKQRLMLEFAIVHH
jgi:hypothetical protein